MCKDIKGRTYHSKEKRTTQKCLYIHLLYMHVWQMNWNTSQSHKVIETNKNSSKVFTFKHTVTNEDHHQQQSGQTERTAERL